MKQDVKYVPQPQRGKQAKPLPISKTLPTAALPSGFHFRAEAGSKRHL
jgi:hypothetical protein